MIRIDEMDLVPFVDQVLQMLEEDVPHAATEETPGILSSQPPVSVEVNIPKVTQEKTKNPYAILLDPNLQGKGVKKTKTNEISKSASATQRNCHDRGHIISSLL